MATRQPSASTGRVKKPRLQVVCSEAVVSKVEALAEERGDSVSSTAAWILEQWFMQQEGNPSSRPADGTYTLVKKGKRGTDEEYDKLMTLFRAAKDSGVL